MPVSLPSYSSMRSFRLSAAAKQSKPLPRLAVLAGTSTDARGDMPPSIESENARDPPVAAGGLRHLDRSAQRGDLGVAEAADQVVVDQAQPTA